eukprot:gene11271-11421_t
MATLPTFVSSSFFLVVKRYRLQAGFVFLAAGCYMPVATSCLLAAAAAAAFDALYNMMICNCYAETDVANPIVLGGSHLEPGGSLSAEYYGGVGYDVHCIVAFPVEDLGGMELASQLSASLSAYVAVRQPMRQQPMIMIGGDVRMVGWAAVCGRLGQVPSEDLSAVAAGLMVVVVVVVIAGHKTGFGNATWLATHPTAQHTAPPVAALLASGAVVVGKTHLDDMAYSFTGINTHYGMPVNVAAPGRVPGGSSSGSAAAVAAGQADIGLGSDTGGSVRWPASFCGLFGIRPTHGRVSLQHAGPLSPSFDTCGWLTRDAELLQQVGSVLLHPPESTSGGAEVLRRCLVARDAFALAQPSTAAAVLDVLFDQRLAAVTELQGNLQDITLSEGAAQATGIGKLEEWTAVFFTCSAFETWQTHKQWVTQHFADLTPALAAKFKAASAISEADWQQADTQRQRITSHLLDLLGLDGVICLPTVPGPALPINTDVTHSCMDDWKRAAFALCSISGLAGLPQVTLPLATVESCPVGLSFIGPRNSDEQLLALAEGRLPVVGCDLKKMI